MSEATQKTVKTMTGVVVTAARDKTIGVKVERQVRHPLYKKIIRRHKKFHAHDENNECQVGDKVVISECRPLSKTKTWKLVKIIEKAN
ncbi:MAG: 30S ribosomal protein S17 [Gammaproteobacteria bacterium]